MAAYGVDVDKDSSLKAIEKIQVLNHNLEFSTEGMDVVLIVEDNWLVEAHVVIEEILA